MLVHEPLSVFELSQQIKACVEDKFGWVRVRGEIGRVSRPASGHIYLDLKDDKAQLAAVIWKGQLAQLAHKPEQGLEVICSGRLTTYGGQSRYQLIIESLVPAGKGALMALIEARRKKLAQRGLFDEAKKKALPFLPERIGVITSPSGAVIRDILHRVKERFARHILIWPVQVQGTKCAEEVAKAIDGMNQLPIHIKPDLLIVARGGGSLEDLQGFNEEAPIFAASRSNIPLISAIGHETDHTLLDLVADRRAPTPTAAAEMAVPVRLDLQAQLHDLTQRKIRACQTHIKNRSEKLNDIKARLQRATDMINNLQQRVDDLTRHLPAALKNSTHLAYEKLARLNITHLIHRLLHDQMTRLGHLARLLDAVSYQHVLKRGFALVRDQKGQPIQRAQQTKIGQYLLIEFADDQQINVQRIQKTYQKGLFDE